MSCPSTGHFLPQHLSSRGRPWPRVSARHKATSRGLPFLCPARERPSLPLYPCVQAAGPPVSPRALALVPIYVNVNKAPSISALSALEAQVEQQLQGRSARGPQIRR